MFVQSGIVGVGVLHSPAGPSRSSGENMGAAGHVVIALLVTLKYTQYT